jgi:hypothetical protein
MKKIITVTTLPSQLQLLHEDALDHCPAPWICPLACYGSCAGCLQNNAGKEVNIRDGNNYREHREQSVRAPIEKIKR